jgi:hypothetical protein
MTRVIVAQFWELWSYCGAWCCTVVGTNVIAVIRCCITVTSDHINETVTYRHYCTTVGTEVIVETVLLSSDTLLFTGDLIGLSCNNDLCDVG